jgi:hypothetical protein
MHEMLHAAGFEVVFTSHFLGWGFPVAGGLAAWHRLLTAIRWRGRTEPAGAVDDRPLPRLLNDLFASLTYWEWRVSLWGLKAPLGVSRLVLARKAATFPVPGEFDPVRLQPMAGVP